MRLRALVIASLALVLLFQIGSLPSLRARLRSRLPSSRTAAASQFNASAWPVYVINGPTNYIQRKWAETELLRIGYSSYTRVNARVFEGADDDCARTQAGGGTCRQGLTHAHYECWKRIAADKVYGALVCEDDVSFHTSFASLFPRYFGTLPPDWAFAYVGQLRRASGPVVGANLTESEMMPWTTHAYILRSSTARLLANHYEYLLARSGSPHAPLPFYDAHIQEATPWVLSNWELNADFLLLTIHRFYFSAQRSWFAFESTAALPASYSPPPRKGGIEEGGIGVITWVDNSDIEALDVAQKNCSGLWGYGSVCTSQCARLVGRASGRMPLLGTGLAFQNRCCSEGHPFALHWWFGGPSAQPPRPPTCAFLRARIRPTPQSEPTPADCVDESEASEVGDA